MKSKQPDSKNMTVINFKYLFTDYYYAHGREGSVISINCNSEIRSYSSYTGYDAPAAPYIIVDDVQYTFEDCSHTDNYGIKNTCDNKTSCSFTVTNTLIGSSCGKGGEAALKLQYHCVRKY